MSLKLTAAAVRHAKAGRHNDGAGLILDVKPGGRAYWTLRYMLAGTGVVTYWKNGVD
jgi:hypothetical protein